MTTGVTLGDFFGRLEDQVEANALRAVDTYARRLSEYRNVSDDPGTYHGLLEFARYLRRRTVALAESGEPFTAEDLAVMTATGRERGESGMSMASQRQVLLVHTDLTLQEVREAATPSDLDQVMRVLGWLGPQGRAAQDAYTEGYLKGRRRHLPESSGMRMLAAMLLAADPMAGPMARTLGMTAHDDYLVLVVRVAAGGSDARPARPVPEAAEVLLRMHRCPLIWQEPDEVVVLLPVQAASYRRALRLVEDLAQLLALPLATGAASGAAAQLPHTLKLARRVAQAAPVQVTPRHVHTVSDLFVELGAAQVPQVDRWLHDVAERLSRGPDLVPTLDAFYRSDMNRLRTAAVLAIHPRTLDYRLQRVRELTGLQPGSTQGVRILSATVTRILAGPAPGPGAGPVGR